jgi:acetylglutamate kinase
MTRDLAVVKIGGKAAGEEDRLREMAAEMAALAKGWRFVVVHGGGAEVTAVSKLFGLEVAFKDGVRLTSPAEMDIVDMVLSGRANKALVRLLASAGLAAVGLSGSDGAIFTAAPLGGDATGAARTGEVDTIDTRLLDLLMSHGFLPVLCSTSMDDHYRGMNINSDAVAFMLAARLGARTLAFLSDIPGVMDEGKVIGDLDAAGARELVDRAVIRGGMVPKVTASLEALAGGVGSVVIGQYEGPGSLARMLDGASGTRIHGTKEKT